MNFSPKGMAYLGSALRIALGAGAVLGSSYFLSRIKERQTLEARLDRLEQLVEALDSGEEKQATGAQERKP